MPDEMRIQKSIKDQEAHLASLQQESLKRAADLTKLEKRITEEMVDLAGLSIEIAEHTKESDDLTEKISEQKLLLSENQKKLSNFDNEYQKVAVENERKKKEALKELDKLNKWVLEATLERDLMTVSSADATRLYSDHLETQSKLEQTRSELASALRDLSKARYDFDILQEVMEKTREDEMTSINEYTHDVLVLESRATDAESKLRAFTEEYDRKMKDLEIYQNRVTEQYKEAFPNRKVKLD